MPLAGAKQMPSRIGIFTEVQRGRLGGAKTRHLLAIFRRPQWVTTFVRDILSELSSSLFTCARTVAHNFNFGSLRDEVPNLGGGVRRDQSCHVCPRSPSPPIGNPPPHRSWLSASCSPPLLTR